MNGNKVVLDMNVSINHLAGDKGIEALLEGTIIYISSITFAELLAANSSHKYIFGYSIVDF